MSRNQRSHVSVYCCGHRHNEILSRKQKCIFQPHTCPKDPPAQHIRHYKLGLEILLICVSTMVAKELPDVSNKPIDSRPSTGSVTFNDKSQSKPGQGQPSSQFSMHGQF